MNLLLAWPVHRPRAALALAVVMTLAAVILMHVRLRAETSIQGLLDKHDPAVVAMNDVLEQFPVVNELLLLVSSTDDQPAQTLLEFADRFRLAVENDPQATQTITRVSYRQEGQSRQFVEKVVVPSALYYLSDEQLAQVLRRLTKEGMAEQLARNEAMLAAPGPAAGALAKTLAKDPLRLHEFLLDRLSGLPIIGADDGDDAFFSPDRRSLLIRIAGTRSPNDFAFARQITALVKRLADETNQDHLQLDIGGACAMAAHSATRIQADTISDVVTTIAGLVILFVIACRRPLRLFTFAFLPVAAGILWGFAAFALIRHAITPLAAVVGGTLGAIGLDYTIHYISHFQEIGESTTAARDAVLRTSRELFLPSLAAWLTSVIGFAAVMISPVRVLRDFAILGTLCLVGAWLATLLVLPALLSTSPRRAAFQIRFDAAGSVGRWIARRARALVIGACAIVVLLIAILLVRGIRYQIESDPMVLHPQPSPPLQAQRRIAERMQLAGGSLIIYLQADSPEQLLTLSHDVQRRLDSATVRSLGLSALLPDPRVASRRESVDPNLAAQVETDLRSLLASSDFRPEAFDGYIQFIKTLTTPAPPPEASVLRDYPEFGRLLLPRDEIERRAPVTRAVTLLFTTAPLETRESRANAVNAVRHALNGLKGATVTGTAVIGVDLEEAMRRDLPRFVILALVLIAGYLLIHFRSFLLAGMSLLPIAVSLLCIVAFISILNLKLNLLHTVIAPLLLGINLDYGIFAVHAWRTSRDAGELKHHFPASFAGLIICGGSTIIGFGSLIVTSIPAVKSLGWLINVGVGSCVLATLLLLWPMMLVRRGARAAKR